MPDWMVGRTEDLTGIDPYLNFHGKIIGEQVGQILSNLPSILLRIVSLGISGQIRMPTPEAWSGFGLLAQRSGRNSQMRCQFGENVAIGC